MFSSMDTLASVVEAEAWALLTTVDRDGGLHTRPVRSLRAPFRGQIWLAIEGDADDDVGEGKEVSLAFGDASQGPYVSVSGWAVVLRDRGFRSIRLHSATAKRRVLCVTARAAQLWERAPSGTGTPDPECRVFAFPAVHARPADEVVLPALPTFTVGRNDAAARASVEQSS